MKYLLSPLELEYCQRVCDSWKHSERNRHIPAKNAYFIGIVGEYVVAKHLRLPTQFVPQDGGDNGYDMLMGSWRVQVKTTSRPYGELMFNSLRHFNADLAVLTYWDNAKSTVTIKGWIDKHHFDLLHEVITLNDSSTRCVLNNSHIRPITQLEILRSWWQTGSGESNSPTLHPSTSGPVPLDTGVPF